MIKIINKNNNNFLHRIKISRIRNFEWQNSKMMWDILLKLNAHICFDNFLKLLIYAI